MAGKRFTLVGDGSSDKVLIHPIRWVLQYVAPQAAFQGEWADLSRLPRHPRTLEARVNMAYRLYPCEVLFVHRDAENESPQARIFEIQTAVAQANTMPRAGHVCVVPVRMTEAWFLFNEDAIRTAAGNPNGSEQLDLPTLSEVERLSDPKDVWYKQLESASGLGKRRLSQFRPQERVHRVAQLIDDYSPLLVLSAFNEVVRQTRSTLAALGGDG